VSQVAKAQEELAWLFLIDDGQKLEKLVPPVRLVDIKDDPTTLLSPPTHCFMNLPHLLLYHSEFCILQADLKSSFLKNIDIPPNPFIYVLYLNDGISHQICT